MDSPGLSPTLYLLAICFEDDPGQPFGQIVSVHLVCRAFDDSNPSLGVLFSVVDIGPKEMIFDIEIFGSG